jgi:HEAT repeat protein
MRIFDIFFKPNVSKLEETKDIEGLIKALNYQKNVSIREAAVDALARIKEPMAIEGLIKALEDAEYRVRSAAVDALARIKKSKAVEGLILALEDAEWTIRSAAVKALGNSKGPRATEPLITKLDDNHYLVCTSAAESLGKRKDGKAVDALLCKLKDFPSYDKFYAVEALLQINSQKAIEGLTQALKNKDYDVREAAAKGLRDVIGSKAVEEQSYKESKEEEINRLIDNLGVIVNSGATEETIVSIIDAVDEGKLRHFEVTEVLNKIDHKKASKIIRDKFVSYSPGSGSSMDRADLADMLIRLNDTSAIPLLKKCLDRGDFSHISWGHIAQFIEDHPEIKTFEEIQTCAVCHTKRPVTEMKGAGDQWFCFDQCWKKRGTVLPTGIGTDCPLFNEGLCSAGNGDSLCSLTQGHYSTDCHVYAS